MKRELTKEPKLTEKIEGYERQGLEILLVDYNPKGIEGCSQCTRIAFSKYKWIYTRLKEANGYGKESQR